MPTHSEENYLKAIWKLHESGIASVSTNSIAAEVKTRAASVTDMLKKLAEKKLIQYEKYQGVKLTADGRRVALSIVRKHRLWEVFLVSKLDYRWDEVHEIAEQLEHIYSENLTDRLDKFLGFPKFDPHGDPIPDKTGKLTDAASVSLSTLKSGQIAVMTGVAEHSAIFLRYLDENEIGLGKTIRVEQITEFDQSLKIKVNNRSSITISRHAAKNILVKVTPVRKAKTEGKKK
jgi:DtxR family Mn-dependent transcriptional regulator